MNYTSIKKAGIVLFASIVILSVFVSLFGQTYHWRSITFLGEIREIAFYNNNLWAVTGGGIFRYTPSSGTFRILNNTDGLSSNNPLSAVLHGNQLWVGMDDGSLNIIDASTFHIRYIQIDPTPIQIRSITQSSGYLYLGLDFGISQFDIAKEEIKATFRNLGNFSINTAVRKVLAADGRLWAATEKGIATVSLSTPNLQDPQFWTNYTTAAGLPSNSINDLTAQGDTIFIGTSSGTARLYNGIISLEGLHDNNIITIKNLNGTIYATTYSSVFKREQPGVWTAVVPAPSDIQTIAADSAGTVWAGSIKKGLYAYHTGQTQWTHIAPLGPGGNTFEEMTLDAQNRLWCATGQSRCAGLYLFENNEWHHYTPTDGLSAYNTIGIAADALGRIWAGTPGQGLMIIEKHTDSLRVTTVNASSGKLCGAVTPDFVIVSRIIRGPGNVMWLVNKFADNGNAIVAVTPQDTWHYFSTADGLSSTIVSDIAFDSAGRLWIATEDKGVNRLDYRGTLSDKSDDRWIHYTELNNMASNRVTRLAADRENGMWVGTENGISYILDGLPIQNFQGALSTFITALAVDPVNNKWFGTKNGISVLLKDNISWIHFTTENSSVVYNDILSFRIDERSGDIYIGTSAGLSVVSTPFKTPPAKFDAIIVFPSPFIIDGSQTRLTIDNIPLECTVKIATSSSRVIRTLTEENGGVIGTRAYWDGRDDENRLVPSGIYIISAGHSKTGSGTAKIAVIRK